MLRLASFRSASAFYCCGGALATPSVVSLHCHSYSHGCRSSEVAAQLHLPLLVSCVRPKAFQAFIDESNPDVTLAHARELKKRESSLGRPFSSKYLNALINVAIGHFQKGDFELARQCALYAHDTIVEHRSGRDTLIYFAATTASACSRARANQLHKMLMERREMGHSAAASEATSWVEEDEANSGSGTINHHENSTLMGGRDYKTNRRASATFKSVELYVAFLRSEATQFDRIARRISDLKLFMKSEEEHKRDNAQEDGGRSADFDSSDSAPPSSTSGGASTVTRAQTAAAMREARQQRRYEDENRRARVAEAEQCYLTQHADYVAVVRAGHNKIRRPGGSKSKGKPIWSYLRVPR